MFLSVSVLVSISVVPYRFIDIIIGLTKTQPMPILYYDGIVDDGVYTIVGGGVISTLLVCNVVVDDFIIVFF
jgi:hypothetical protein